MVLACRIRELDKDADWSFYPNDINLLQQTKIMVAMKMVADVGDELVVMDIELRRCVGGDESDVPTAPCSSACMVASIGTADGKRRALVGSGATLGEPA